MSAAIAMGAGGVAVALAQERSGSAAGWWLRRIDRAVVMVRETHQPFLVEEEMLDG